MADLTPGMIFTDTLRNKQPDALAWIRGNAQNPQLSGIVKFYETPMPVCWLRRKFWASQYCDPVFV